MKKYGHKIERILRVYPESFEVRLRFSDRFTGTISLNHLFESPRGLTAEILRGDMFGQCFIESGALAWPNGFELCPDMLRSALINQSKKLAA